MCIFHVLFGRFSFKKKMEVCVESEPISTCANRICVKCVLILKIKKIKKIFHIDEKW